MEPTPLSPKEYSGLGPLGFLRDTEWFLSISISTGSSGPSCKPAHRHCSPPPPEGKQHQRVNPQGFLHPLGIPLTMDFQKQSDV